MRSGCPESRADSTTCVTQRSACWWLTVLSLNQLQGSTRRAQPRMRLHFRNTVSCCVRRLAPRAGLAPAFAKATAGRPATLRLTVAAAGSNPEPYEFSLARDSQQDWRFPAAVLSHQLTLISMRGGYSFGYTALTNRGRLPLTTDGPGCGWTH